nr:type I pullulanase [Youngiibacter multivorans]
MQKAYDSRKFRESNTYEGDDLGVRIISGKTYFRLWSPFADSVQLKLYKSQKGGSPFRTVEMARSTHGTWLSVITGDLSGTCYTFDVNFSGHSHETADPYARAAGINGNRSMVIRLEDTDPPGFREHKKPEATDPVNSIIYEVHVRDLSVSPSSGIRNKGLFLGFTESGTRNPHGFATGIDHIRELGATHVQLLPIFDFFTVDEEKGGYNWGYDPYNYNVPEGSYSTDPFDGMSRIRELKEAIMAMHKKGLKVIMDVVYNHTGITEGSWLNLSVPYYYHRTKGLEFSDASACGNETASERPMARKYIIDSVLYWLDEYKLDGFRFDLMGIHDIETMSLIEEKVHEKDPSALIYGEGWTAKDSPLPEDHRMVKKNIIRTKRIGAFNDDLRDAIRGHVFKAKSKGFVAGATGSEEALKFGIAGAVSHPQVDMGDLLYSSAPWAGSPEQSINYCAAHDNHTLYDKLRISGGSNEEHLRDMSRLSDAIVLTSQGIPFLHAGSEFLRTKNGDENSYKSGDVVNMLDWNLKTKNIDIFHYYKGLAELRKSRKALRLGTAEDIRKNLVFYGKGKGSSLRIRENNVVAYIVSSEAPEKKGSLLVAFNGSRHDVILGIPDGSWSILVDKEKAGTLPIGIAEGGSCVLKGTSALVLEANGDFELKADYRDFHDSRNRKIILAAALLSAGLIALHGRFRKKR